jgi:hypothetical protein
MPLILGTNSIKDTGFNINNSLRFNSGSDDNLSITPDSAGNRNKWTWSGWVKRSTASTASSIFGVYIDGANQDHLYFQSGGKLDWFNYNAGAYTGRIVTTRLFRDVSAWYHIVAVYDNTLGTDTDRMKFYINGVRETTLEQRTEPVQNTTLSNVNTTGAFKLGNDGNGAVDTDGYMSEVVFIDGLALAADSFGEFDDSGIWKPIDVSGLTFGDEGFYLEFKQSGTSANASGLGADTSGNTNHFTVNNLTAVDQSTDTCTNNFATMNILDTNSNHTLSEGNLKTVYSAAAGTFGVTKGTIGVSAGKWYWEIKYTYGNAGQFGVFDVNDLDTLNTTDIFSAAGSSTFQGLAWRIDTSNNIKEVGVGQSADSGLDFTSGAILGIAFDADNGKFYGFKNGAEITGQDIGAGTSLLTAVTVSDFYLPFVSNGDGGSGTKTGTSEFNFGSPPFAISSSNTDPNGYGNFEFPTNGYYALCTKNLAEFG